MGGWNTAGSESWNVRRGRASGLPRVAGRWTAPDIAATVIGFVIHWEIGLGVLALKLWQQAAGYEGNVFTFARDRWERLVGATRTLMSGLPTSVSFGAMPFGPRTSGNHVFDAWRQGELERIEAERAKLRAAEREFAVYRDELLHAKDREDFDRFMQARHQNKAG